ncbi:hypothetical protein MPTK1_3g01140 [Marchantia polymorpha subsp. ruderalis]|uniref:Uncharacterized protein n=2 Tax=Marchantia polymorpha TaxID=3197 RepID=A0AAF6AW77_MARPO|nr:hypothetical protein MARPO_0007s0108 [Marchantia polymorpha]BBN04011.1 hypothetical protein Mp_3g01140 [Marchantia polymorpha subsp. ruderalis]|eukprot:PTQ47699.1 hypothetical protein MARPO_0007s0108 [Marchantia polymorpha]
MLIAFTTNKTRVKAIRRDSQAADKSSADETNAKGSRAEVWGARELLAYSEGRSGERSHARSYLRSEVSSVAESWYVGERERVDPLGPPKRSVNARRNRPMQIDGMRFAFCWESVDGPLLRGPEARRRNVPAPSVGRRDPFGSRRPRPSILPGRRTVDVPTEQRGPQYSSAGQSLSAFGDIRNVRLRDGQQAPVSTACVATPSSVPGTQRRTRRNVGCDREVSE